MNAHFSSFTSEAMRAFREGLAADFQRRAEFIHNLRKHTMLEGFRHDRRRRVKSEADARGLFVSELKSGVHSLLNRFELGRREMAREFQAARDAWRNRTGSQGGQQPKQTQSSAKASSIDEAKPRHSRKRHG
ncbi:MAG TPA: hypothetical protein VM425_07485 [Myxococcota bacterium]|nr:hypothetical protein [Myxococcota bacterium]